MTASYLPSSRANRSRRAPIPCRRSLSVYITVAYVHGLLLIDRMASVTHQWSRRRRRHALLPTVRRVVCLDVGHPSRRCCKLKSSKATCDLYASIYGTQSVRSSVVRTSSSLSFVTNTKYRWPAGCVTACVIYGRFDSRFDSNEKKTIRRSLVSVDD